MKLANPWHEVEQSLKKLLKNISVKANGEELEQSQASKGKKRGRKVEGENDVVMGVREKEKEEAY